MNALVLLPTYNERNNLPSLVEALLTHTGVSVLVIDDNSPDGTGVLAARLAETSSGRLAVMHRSSARGLGRAYLAGFRTAFLGSADFIIQMDADWSHDPADLSTLLASGASGAGLTIGSRYVPGGAVRNWPRRRVALSAAANAYIRRITGISVADCTSGFRCWRREAAAQLDLNSLRSNGYSFLVEMLFRAIAAGVSVSEVPITFVERREGRSKLSLPILLESLTTPWTLRRKAGRPRCRRPAGALKEGADSACGTRPADA